jgi:hypothetical protein
VPEFTAISPLAPFTDIAHNTQAGTLHLISELITSGMFRTFVQEPPCR